MIINANHDNATNYIFVYLLKKTDWIIP